MQNVLIVVLFLALILISGGIGALAAGRTDFGIIFAATGGGVLLIDIVVLLLVRKRKNSV